MKGGMQQLMKQANQMQARMKKMQEELAQREYEATSGGGAVTAKVNGDNLLVALSIDPEVAKEDHEMLEDLILTATNEALKKAKTETEAEMGKVTGGLNIPGMF